MWFKKLKIKTKLILLLNFSAAIALLISLLGSSYHTYEFEKERYIQTLQQLSMITSKNIEASLVFDDIDSARHMLVPLKIDDTIISVAIYDNKNELFIKIDFNEKSALVDFTKFIDIEKKYIDWEYIFVSTPVVSNNTRIGKLVILSSIDDLKQNVIDKILFLSIIVIFVLIIIILLSIKLQTIFSKPIIELSEVMLEISQTKNYEIQVVSKYDDEFGTLYKGFNSMISEINKKDASVHELLDTLHSAKDELQTLYNQVNQSIDYASLIQGILVPEIETLNSYFSTSFAIWHPKDKVSGDIYMIRPINENELIVMVLDCTGHGVSGAFLTILTKALETQVITSSLDLNNQFSPAKILASFNKSMKSILKQESKKSILNVGFDAQIIHFNKQTNLLKFAGARNPLYYICDGELHEIKGDKHSIGYKNSDVDFVFTNYEIQTKKDMIFYLATDGYWDQLGGEKKLPFGKRRFKEFLLKHHKENMQDQQELLLYGLDDYEQMSSKKRNDDITIVGLKV